MSARGFGYRLRRGLAMVLALLALAVGVLWADSYRGRALSRLERDYSGFFTELFDLRSALLDPHVGMDRTIAIREGQILGIRTWEGRLRLSLEVIADPSKPLSKIRKQKLNFGYTQMSLPFWEPPDPDGKKMIPTRYHHVRQGMTPFWALIVCLAVYPAVFLYNGPLRRRRRRRRGQCVNCGYDVSQSPGRCPECGTAVNRPCSPTAGDLAE